MVTCIPCLIPGNFGFAERAASDARMIALALHLHKRPRVRRQNLPSAKAPARTEAGRIFLSWDFSAKARMTSRRNAQTGDINGHKD